MLWPCIAPYSSVFHVFFSLGGPGVQGVQGVWSLDPFLRWQHALSLLLDAEVCLETQATSAAQHLWPASDNQGNMFLHPLLLAILIRQVPCAPELPTSGVTSSETDSSNFYSSLMLHCPDRRGQMWTNLDRSRHLKSPGMSRVWVRVEVQGTSCLASGPKTTPWCRARRRAWRAWRSAGADEVVTSGLGKFRKS